VAIGVRFFGIADRIVHVKFQLGAWYHGVLGGTAQTFQVLEFGTRSLMRIKVFRIFYAGKMLATEEWVKGEDLTDCKNTPEPEDTGSW